MRTRFVLTMIVTLATGAPGTSRSAQSSGSYEIIVNAKNPTGNVDRQLLADVFLKKVTNWPDGSVVRPADLAPSSAIRRRFTGEVLRRSIAEVKSYWQQRIFSGRDVPPPEFDNDEEAVSYVLKYDGAVAYVSGDADLRGAKVLAVR